MTILEPENDHNIKNNDWLNIFFKWIFNPLNSMKKRFTLLLSRLITFTNFSTLSALILFSTSLVLQGSTLLFKILFALVHIKIIPS